ncbi:unnamed protein product [Aphanomyces euteiches]
MSVVDDWDFGADLDFLLPGVTDLEADLASVCDLFPAEPVVDLDNLVKDWHIYKLPAEQSQRHRAIHGIADRQRARKSTEYINADLVTQSENIVRVRPVVHAKAQAVKYEVVSYIRLPAPCAAVSRALWQVYAAGDKTPPSSSSAQVIREQVDEHTIYERFTDTRDGVTSYACTVRKYFADDHEHLIVLQSVLEDEMHPHMASGAVENESVWVAIEPLDDLSCCVKLLVHLIFDASTYPSGKYDRSIEAITESLGDVKLEEKIPPDGFFVTGILIPQAVDKFPGYASFVSRRIQLKAALRRAVYEKVRDFQQSTKRYPSSPSTLSIYMQRENPHQPGQQIPHLVEKFPGYVALNTRPDPNQSDPVEGSVRCNL